MSNGEEDLSNEPALPKGFLQHCLLLLLGEHATHGYDLVERLRPFGFDGSDPGGTYRALRAMERRNLVKSSWEDSEAGPHRRVYELTDEGRALLDRDAESWARRTTSSSTTWRATTAWSTCRNGWRPTRARLGGYAIRGAGGRAG